MQVKEIYLDLKEGEQYAKKNNNVWTLTSEAFKDPLKIKLVYDNEDKKLIEKSVLECKNYYEKLELKEIELDKKIKQQEYLINEMKRIRDEENELLGKAKELILSNRNLESNITDLQNVNNENFTILLNKIKETNQYILNHPQKQIYRYHGEELINGLDPYYWEIKIPSGKYITIESITVHPQNEFVLNEDQTTYKTIIVDDVYNVAIQLQGENAIDKPTALIELDILFFQI